MKKKQIITTVVFISGLSLHASAQVAGFVESKSGLPKCPGVGTGQVFFVQEQDEFIRCSEKGWEKTGGDQVAPKKKDAPNAATEIALRGAKGDRGDVGPRGDQGPRGEIGLQGPKGDPGPDGQRGEKGEKGDTGTQGIHGQKGDTGSEGKQGERGVAGPRGEKGEPGPQGLKGDIGAQGPKGEQGEPGPSGEVGKVGLVGQTGSPGLPGKDGAHGHSVGFETREASVKECPGGGSVIKFWLEVDNVEGFRPEGGDSKPTSIPICNGVEGASATLSQEEIKAAINGAVRSEAGLVVYYATDSKTGSGSILGQYRELGGRGFVLVDEVGSDGKPTGGETALPISITQAEALPDGRLGGRASLDVAETKLYVFYKNKDCDFGNASPMGLYPGQGIDRPVGRRVFEYDKDTKTWGLFEAIDEKIMSTATSSYVPSLKGGCRSLGEGYELYVFKRLFRVRMPDTFMIKDVGALVIAPEGTYK